MILKHVRNRYYEITVTVNCKAHAQRPKAILYKVLPMPDLKNLHIVHNLPSLISTFISLLKDGRRVEGARSHSKGEINTAYDKLPFSDESFKVYRDGHLA